MRISLLIALALLVAPSASAVGPWLGVATSSGAWSATPNGGATVVTHGKRSVSIAGNWGFPIVTLREDVGGLSADGRTLVLAHRNVAHPNGALARKTSFAVLGTSPLRIREVVTVKGDFGFDALSPDGATLYLIQHVSEQSLFKYRVRAYDLDANRLLPQAIADERQQSWNMEGFPVARATTADGRWVYTFYSNGNNYPFVHALDAANRTAVCVGIPWNWATDQSAIDNATLKIVGGKLSIDGRFMLDRSTFEVTKG
jgi:hypothetical protein